MDQIAFNRLISQIVREDIPEEMDVYELFGEDQVGQVFEGEEILGNNGEGEAFNRMGSGVIEVLQHVGLIAGTFSSIIQIAKYLKDKKRKKAGPLADYWTSQLMASGLPQDAAEKISKKHYHKLLGLIETDLFERGVSPGANRIASLSDGHPKANMAHALDEVRRSLAEGYLSEAALQLQELLSQEKKDIRNELIVISAEVSRTERSGRMNLTPQHELLRMKNAQTKSLLDFIDSLQTELI